MPLLGGLRICDIWCLIIFVGYHPNTTGAELADLKANNVSVAYGATKIVSEASFTADQGDLTVLVGPNGCGKSTLLKAIARVLPLQQGQVRLGQLNVHKTPTKKVAKQLALLPQGPIAPEGLTVRELVSQGRFPHQNLLRQWSKQDAEAVDRSMARANVTDFADLPIAELSGGQRQRCWIAMILAQETPVLLLDEPTTFLDLKVQVDLMALLRDIAHNEGRTVLVVLHDLNVAASFADRMIMMKSGRIVANGHVKDVLTPQNLKNVFDLKADIVPAPETGLPVCVPQTAALGHSHL